MFVDRKWKSCATVLIWINMTSRGMRLVRTRYQQVSKALFEEIEVTRSGFLIYRKSNEWCFRNCRSMCWICSTVIEDRKNRRNWEKSEGHFGETFWYKFIYLFVHPTWSFKHHSRLFAGFLMFIYIWWIYSRILLFSTSLFKSLTNKSFSASKGISCHVIISYSLLNCLRPKGFGVVYPTALPVIIKYPSKLRTI